MELPPDVSSERSASVSDVDSDNQAAVNDEVELPPNEWSDDGAQSAVDPAVELPPDIMRCAMRCAGRFERGSSYSNDVG